MSDSLLAASCSSVLQEAEQQPCHDTRPRLQPQQQRLDNSLTGDDSHLLQFSSCELHGYFGDTLKCCPSQSSIVTDSGLSSMSAGLSASSSSSSLLTFEARSSSTADFASAIPDVPDHEPRRSPKAPATPSVIYVLSYLCWCILGAFALFRTMLLRLHIDTNTAAQESRKQKHFPPLYNHWDALFVHYIYRRMRDVLNRPIAGKPAVIMALKDRVSHDANFTYEYPGTTTDVINLGSYNYLGFAEHDSCNQVASQAVDTYGIGIGSAYHELGVNVIHRQLEETMAGYLGVEDCFCTPMGFGTNTMNIPALMGEDALILSDELNHASIILGCRYSGAVTKVFHHNSARDCERVIVQSLQQGNPKTGRPYSKILIVIEGLYSMEGTIAHLKDFVRIKKKYKCYLFMDEAHSIGALGKTGRGVCEYWGVDPNDVDILMGTFTKSFSAAGGYIAGRRDVINRIRLLSHASYASTMAPPVAAQVLSALHVLTGNDGTDDGRRRLAALRVNTRHFRRRLRDAGFLVYGNADAPVVPTLTFFPSKVTALSRLLLERRIGIVIVGFPATPIATERARFCLSASHTIEQLDYAVDCLIDAGDKINIRYLKGRPAKEDGDSDSEHE